MRWRIGRPMHRMRNGGGKRGDWQKPEVTPTLIKRGYSGNLSGASGRVFVAKGVRASNVLFYQTNPPIFRWKTAVIKLRYNGLRGKNLSRNGGFVFRNEPTGPPSRGRYGG